MQWAEDPETEVDRCIAPTQFRKVCLGGKESIGCNSCPKYWYEGPLGDCEKCGASGSLSMVLLGVFSPMLCAWLYRSFNKDVNEAEFEDEEPDDEELERQRIAQEHQEELSLKRKSFQIEEARQKKIASGELKEDEEYVHEEDEVEDHKGSRMPKSRKGKVKWVLHRLVITLQEVKSYVLMFQEQVIDVMKDCFELLLEFIQAAMIICSFEIEWGQVVDYDPGAAPESAMMQEVLKLRRAASMQTEAMTAKLGLKQGCATSSFFQKFTFSMVGPAALCAIFFFNFYVVNRLWGPVRRKCGGIAEKRKHVGKIAKLAQKIAEIEITKDKTINAVGVLVNTFFISICRNSMALFITFKHPSDRKGLVLYPEVFYGDADWVSVFPVGLGGLVFYFFGIFTALGFISYIGPMNYHEKSFRVRYFFFFDGVKPNVYWWRLWVMTRAVMLNITMTMSNDSRMQIMMCNLIYTMSVSMSFSFNAWPTKVQNIVDVCCGLAMIVLLAAISFHLRMDEGEEDDLGNNKWLVVTEVTSFMFPMLVLVACTYIPLMAFYHRVAHASATYNLAQRFRDLMILAICQNNTEMNGFICSLNDSERTMMEETMGICFSQMLNLQPYDSFWGRRLISELPEGADTQMYATEDVILSNMVHRIKDDPMKIYLPLRERMFVQWYLDETTMAYYKKYNIAPRIVDLFKELFELSGAEPPPPPIDPELERDDFIHGTRVLAPVITEVEAEGVFEIVDTDGGGSLTQEEFIIVFSGMGGSCAMIHHEKHESFEFEMPKWLGAVGQNKVVQKVVQSGTRIWKKIKEKEHKKNYERKRDSIIAGHNETKERAALAQKSGDHLGLQELAQKAKDQHHFSMREALNKLHVILEGEAGYEKKLRAYRARKAAVAIQRNFRAAHKRRQAEMRAARGDDQDDAMSIGHISTGPDVPEEWVDEDMSEQHSAGVGDAGQADPTEGKNGANQSTSGSSGANGNGNGNGNGSTHGSNGNGSHSGNGNGGERLVCQSCRCVNPPGNDRCGMCGEPLQ